MTVRLCPLNSLTGNNLLRFRVIRELLLALVKEGGWAAHCVRACHGCCSSHPIISHAALYRAARSHSADSTEAVR